MKLLAARTVALLMVCLLGLLPGSTFAQTKSFTLRPGGVATITFEAYCTEFGKFFPQDPIQAPNAVAPAKVRAAIEYIRAKGFSSDPKTALEAQYGLWKVIGASGVPAGGPTTQDVVSNGTSAPSDPAGTSLLDAAKAGDVKLAITSWKPIGDKVQILSATDNFYGQGTLTVENVSQQSLELYLPVGTLFPAADAKNQTMGGYATDVQVKNPGLPATAGETPPFALLLLALLLLCTGVLLRRATRQPA